MTLYRKHRPQLINELDLEDVRKTLQGLAKDPENLPQQLMFAGPRGSGKTSAARIIAKLVNCENPVKTEIGSEHYYEPCNKCDQCNAINKAGNIDVIEMDAASNRGIDDIRSLRDSVSLAPNSAKRKVYVLDEAHMLTTEAANAFLKTLEEPPSHVIFILATTDPEKLPGTVRSRLTTISFKKAKLEEIERQLNRVSEKEKLSIEPGVIEMISNQVDGSFRDAVKMLESLLVSGKNITKKLTESHIKSASGVNPENLLSSILEKDSKEALGIIDKYAQGGGSVKHLIDSLVISLREKLLSQTQNSEDIITLINMLFEAKLKLKATNLEQLPLEIAIISWANKSPKSEVKTESKEEIKPEVKKKIKIKSTSFDEDSWAKILSCVKEKNASVEALLRASKPFGLDGNTFKVGVYYRFHKERLETNDLRRALEDSVSEILGVSPIKVICDLTEREKPLPKRPDPPMRTENGLTKPGEEDIISAAKELFGN